MDLSGAHALVTGGSRGIGPHIARALLARGARVTLTARSEEGLAAARDRLGAGVAVVAADLLAESDRARLVAEAEAAHGPVDALVNNAGIEDVRDLAEQDPGTVSRIIASNLDAPIRLTRLLLPGMLARRKGHIVNVSSLAGKAIVPHNSVYAATKHGLNGFTYALRSELRGSGVSASIVMPGYVAGEGMFSRWVDTHVPRGSGAGTTPAKVARAVVRAIARDRPEVTAAGLLPRLSDVSLAISPAITDALARRTRAYELLRRQARR